MTLLSGLSISKAHGTYNIIARSLKVVASDLSFPLATIFNNFLLTGTIPSEWGQAVVTQSLKREIARIPLAIGQYLYFLYAGLFLKDWLMTNWMVTSLNITCWIRFSQAFNLGIQQPQLCYMSLTTYVTKESMVQSQVPFWYIDTNIFLHKPSAIDIHEI